jgi:aspartyl-tRNA(Asn)/glutamyl-tRNA(Gln) amidotransferase subunit C
MSAPDSPLITTAEVERIAQLAHLALSAEETAKMTVELGHILAYVEQLEEVSIEGVEPTAHVQIDRLPLRPDEPTPSLAHDVALREAPRVSEGGFAVPAFVDEG